MNQKKIIFNLLDSGIDFRTMSEYRKIYSGASKNKYGGLIHQGKKPGSYFHWVCWTATPVIDWCYKQELDIKIQGGPYAMQLTFTFRNDAEAAQFILRWL